MNSLLERMLPSLSDVKILLCLFEEELFPQASVASNIKHEELREQLLKVLAAGGGDVDAHNATCAILASLETIRNQLLLDAQFTLDKDPAALSIQEVILCYPGFKATLGYRLAHTILRCGVSLVPRMLSECTRSMTGIDIHPGAQIAAPFFIDHGTGVVIGETAIIGKNVHVYQGVTLGALVVNKADAGHKRHPTIGDNVVIYANSTILGGATHIGDNSIIGGNTWLTKGVPAYSVVYTEHKTIVRDRDLNQPMDFSI